MRHTSRRSLALLATALSVVGLTTSSSAAAAAIPAASASVPAKYQSLYDQLSGQLDAYERAVAAMPRARMRRGHPPTAGAELLAANGNRLSALLQPGAMYLVDARSIACVDSAWAA